MNNREFVQRLAQSTGISSIEVAEMQAACIDRIVAEVRDGNTVMFQGFGTFETKEKAERKIFIPSTKEYKVVPARQTVGFRPGPTLRERFNSKPSEDNGKEGKTL